MSTLGRDEYARLLTEAQPKLLTLATAICGGRAAAEDVVQEAAITGLEKLAGFEPGTNFLAWISQIVRFKSLKQREKEKKRKTSLLPTDSIDAAAPSTSGLAASDKAVTAEGGLRGEQQAFDDRLVKALETLEPERRACLLLRAVHSLSYDQIAEIVGVPAGTAMSHVHRAKAAMRGCLNERLFRHEASNA